MSDEIQVAGKQEVNISIKMLELTKLVTLII